MYIRMTISRRMNGGFDIPKMEMPKMEMPKMPDIFGNKKSAPVVAPVVAPVSAPVVAPVATPVSAPVATPVSAPVAGGRKRRTTRRRKSRQRGGTFKDYTPRSGLASTAASFSGSETAQPHNLTGGRTRRKRRIHGSKSCRHYGCRKSKRCGCPKSCKCRKR